MPQRHRVRQVCLNSALADVLPLVPYHENKLAKPVAQMRIQETKNSRTA
jgi:hypothetical protein